MKSQSLRFPITSLLVSLIVIASTHSKTSMANLSTTTSEQSGFSESALSLKPRLSEKQSELMALLDEKNEDAINNLLKDPLFASPASLNFLLQDATPLMRAAKLGLKDTAKRLIEKNVPLDTVNKNNASALMFAAYGGYTEIVDLLIRAGANVRLEHTNGFEAFDFALEKPHRTILLNLIQKLARNKNNELDPLVEYALSKRFKENQQALTESSKNQSLALIATVINQDLQKLSQLLRWGISPNVHNVTGYAALPLAARFNQKEMIEELLKFNADINLGNNGNDEASALNQAARSANDTLIDWLLQQGADVNKANARGYTALHISTYRQCMACIRNLLAAGANISLKTENDHTVLDISKILKNTEMTELFLNHQEAQSMIDTLINKVRDKKLSIGDISSLNHNQLTTYSSQGRLLIHQVILHQPELLEHLLSMHVDVNQQETAGLKATPLMYATSRNDLKSLKALLANGAKINTVDAMGNPALDWASYYGFEQLVSELLKQGAIVNKTSPHGDALDISLRRGHKKTQQVIVEHMNLPWSSSEAKAAFSAIDKKDFSAIRTIAQSSQFDSLKDPVSNSLLHHAVLERCLACAEIFLKHGFSVDVTNRIGLTPLMIAAQQGDAAVLQLLIQHGANVNAHAFERGMKITPLMLASIHNQERVIDLLVENNAKLDLVDTMGNTAALWALGEGKTRVGKKLLALGSNPDLKNNMGYSASAVIKLIAKSDSKGEQQ